MGTPLAEPRCAVAGAVPARHLHRRLPGGPVRPRGARRAEPVTEVISRLTAEWGQEYDHWQRRDLSARHYVYIWADGIYLQARMEPAAECMLVVIGATPEGKKELIGFQVGTRESAQSWRELLVDLKARGLAVSPKIAIGDGALGFWKALEEVFPATGHQRCWLHKIVNVLNEVPKSLASQIKSDLNEICRAPDRSTATAALDNPHLELL